MQLLILVGGKIANLREKKFNESILPESHIKKNCIICYVDEMLK